MRHFKAIEVDPLSRQRTGRELVFDTETRQAAIDALLDSLGVPADSARIDPTRTLVDLDGHRWTIVAIPSLEGSVPPSVRRAGAKHKRVR